MEKVPGNLGAKPGQIQQGSREGFGEGSGSGRLWCRARSRSTGFRKRLRCRQGFGAEPGQVHQRSKPGQVQRVPEKVAEPKPSQVRCFQRFASQHAAGRCVKTTRCRCWGYHRGFFFPAVFSAGAWSCDSVYTALSPDVLTAVIRWSVPSCVESFYTGLSSMVRNPTCVLGVVKRLGDGWVGGNLHDCLGARSWPRGKG